MSRGLTPISAPQANGIAQRLIGTIRRECLDHAIDVNERHQLHVLREFIRYDNEARSHQALDLKVPHRQPRASPATPGRTVSRPALGGLTREYEREVT